MKSHRTIGLLLAAIAAVIAVHGVWTRHERTLRPTGSPTLLNPSAACDDLVLERSGSQPVHLHRSGGWQMLEPYAAIVDDQVVLKLLDAIVGFPILDTLSNAALERKGLDRASLALEKPALKLTLSGSFGSETLLVGSLTTSTDGVYVSLVGVPAVYVVSSSLISALDLTAEKFRCRQLFKVSYPEIESFDLKCGVGERHSFAQIDGVWKHNDEQASEPEVRRFIEGILQAKALDFVWPRGMTNEEKEVTASLLSGYGLDPDNAVTVTLKGAGGSRQLAFGKISSEGKVFALAQNARAVVTVPVALKDSAVNNLQRFLESRLFVNSSPGEVEFFRIVDGEVAYAATRAESDSWRLDSPIVAPADDEVVGKLLDNIISLTTADLRENGVEVSLSTNAPPEKVDRSRLLAGVELCNLRSREILKVEPKRAKRIVRVTGGNVEQSVSVVFNREARVWNLEKPVPGTVIDADGVKAVLKALDPLSAMRIEKLKVSNGELSKYGLDHPFVTLAIDQEVEGEFRRNILLGNLVDGGCYATIGASDAVFVLPDATVRLLTAALVEKQYNKEKTMIQDQLSNADRYLSLNPRFAQAFEFLRSHDLAALPVGRHEIDGDKCYANVMELELKPVESEMLYEAHERYYDIQVPVSGAEVMGVMTLPPEHGEYDAKKECYFFKASGKTVTVNPGEFIIFAPPEDAHAPGHSAEAPKKIKKIVVKVLADKE